MENDDENIHVDIGALRVSIQFQPTVSKLKAMRIREMIIKKKNRLWKKFSLSIPLEKYRDRYEKYDTNL